MTNRIRLTDQMPECPEWAGGFGVDRFGFFAELLWGSAVYSLRWIAPGNFEMGSPEGETGRYSDEGPRHPVTVERGFWLGETPVTQAFYEAVTENNPSRFKSDAQRPVENVSWEDSKAFCQALGHVLPVPHQWRVGLPSEAEWEYACRAGTKGPLYSDKPLTSESGRCPNLDELAWYRENSGQTTHPVKGKVPNRWGLYDMLGNVWEWCEDEWHNSYDGAPNNARVWSSEGEGRSRVFRGGSWILRARNCRSASRLRYEPGYRFDGLGFRLVLARSSTGYPVPSLE